MGKKHKKASNHRGSQAVTLCISTSLVLILLGLVIFFVLTGRNLSSYVRENIVVTLMLEQDMTNSEAQQLGRDLRANAYVAQVNYISKEEALREGTKDLGVDPSEFIGDNPYLPSMELHLKADYANNDSLRWITKALKKYPRVTEVNYRHALVESMNRTLARVGIVLLILAGLLTFISFSLINNTVRLGIYARRFSIHTMKLVGASWGFIRRPFIWRAVGVGLLAAFIALLVLAGCFYLLYLNEPDIFMVVTWLDLGLTAGAVLLFGVIITAICAYISVNRFLRMKASELYKI